MQEVLDAMVSTYTEVRDSNISLLKSPLLSLAGYSMPVFSRGGEDWVLSVVSLFYQVIP